jgi:hypothetical protein
VEVFVKDEKVVFVAVIIVFPFHAVPNVKVTLALPQERNFRAAAADCPRVLKSAADLLNQPIKCFAHIFTNP